MAKPAKFSAKAGPKVGAAGAAVKGMKRPKVGAAKSKPTGAQWSSIRQGGNYDPNMKWDDIPH